MTTIKQACNRLVVLALAAFGSSCAARADEIQSFVAGATDLTVPESYSGNRVPSAGEYVALSEGVVHVTYGTPSWDKLVTLGRVVCTTSAGSPRLEITVPGGQSADLAVPVTGQGVVEYQYWKCGGILKKGGGTLNLLHYDKANASDFCCPIDVDEGCVAVKPQQAGVFAIGAVTTAAGAVCDIQPYSQYQACYMYGIFGYGMLTNSLANLPVKVCIENNADAPGVAYGPVGGQMAISLEDIAAQEFWCPQNTFTQIEAKTRRVGAYSIGSASLSSLGVGLVYLSPAAFIEYLGSGETSTKTLTLADAGKGVCISSGPNGGLTLGGEIANPGTLEHMQRLTLSGDGVATFAASTPSDWARSGQTLTLSLAKDGTGVWHFAENERRLHGGGLAVFNGTLEFDTVEEAGRISSLGVGTNLTDNYAGAWTDESHRADYFLTLGATAPDAKAVFKFTGTRSQTCSSRPIRMVGDGTFRNDGNAMIRWLGVTSDAGNHTITLDGDSVRTNELADISDGVAGGKLSVCKDGDGVWAIGGDTTFTGSLEVRRGTLIVRKPQPGAYTWLRWTWRHLGLATEDGSESVVTEIAICDSDNVRCDRNLSGIADYGDLQPGEAAFASCYRLKQIDGGFQGVSGFFDRSYGIWGGHFGATFHKPCTTGDAGKLYVRARDPSSWVSFVLRLPEGAHEIASWDMLSRYGWKSYAQFPTDTRWEGSVDGLHWETADEHGQSALAESVGTTQFSWAFSATALTGAWDELDVHAGGRAFRKTRSTRAYSALTGGESVKVAKGARLMAEGDVALSKLTVDARGSGTVEGFRLADSGVFEVVGYAEAGKPEEMPCAFANVADLDKLAGWQVKVDGRLRPAYSLDVRDGKVYLRRPGAAIIVR